MMAQKEATDSKAWMGVLAFFVVLALLGPTLLYRGVFDPDRVKTDAPVSDAVYYTSGEVTELDWSNLQVYIDHEAVPGVMEAMTMPFYVRDDSVLKRVRVGDLVRFGFRRRERGFWIDEITPTSAEAGP